MSDAAEERMMLGKRRFDLAVGRQSFALREHQLPRRFPFRKRPIRDAVLRNQSRGELRDARAILRVATEGVGSVGTTVARRMAAMTHRMRRQNS